MNNAAWMDYGRHNPYNKYAEEQKNVWLDGKDLTKKPLLWGDALVGLVFAVALPVAVPTYRTFLNVKDFFVTIKDLFSKEYESKRGARFVFNITSTLLLDPLYTLAGIVQSVILIALAVFTLIPYTILPLQVAERALFFLEWTQAELYAKLAAKLDVDDRKV